MRKKLLVQVRDKKTLAIDTIFPLVLIVCGLALASVSIFKDGKNLIMSPALFPKGNDIWYNSESAFISDGDDIKTFMETHFALPKDDYTIKGSIPVYIDKTNTTNTTDIKGALMQMDD